MQFSDEAILQLRELDWSLERTARKPMPRAKRRRWLGRVLLFGLAYSAVAYVPSHVYIHLREVAIDHAGGRYRGDRPMPSGAHVIDAFGGRRRSTQSRFLDHQPKDDTEVDDVH